MDNNINARVPWSREPSLKAVCEDLGVDFDLFIEGIKNEQTDADMAREFNVSEKIIADLKEHFWSKGISSVMGQD